MKRFLFVLIIFAISSCARNENVKLEKGTPNYALAEELAKKVPELDPEKNMILATTNQFNITVGDVMDRIYDSFGKRANELANRKPVEISNLCREMIQSVMFTKIAEIESEKEGLVVTDAQIDSIINQQYKAHGGEEKYLEFLTKNGLDMKTVRDKIKMGETQRLYINWMREKNAPVSESEIDSAMKGDHLATVRHILLRFKGNSDQEKKQVYTQMEKILARVKAGEDFAKVAKEVSEDPGSKNKGGLYENFPRGQMVPSFENAAFSVPVGEISDIIETPYGYHILKVIDRKKETRSREVVKKELMQKKMRNLNSSIFENLKKQYEFKLTAFGTE